MVKLHSPVQSKKDRPFGNAGAVFCWAFGGAMKSKSPPPPFKKGGEKAPDFFNSKR